MALGPVRAVINCITQRRWVTISTSTTPTQRNSLADPIYAWVHHRLVDWMSH